MRHEKATIADHDLTYSQRVVLVAALDAFIAFLQGDFSEVAKWFGPGAYFDDKQNKQVCACLARAEREAKHWLAEAQRSLFDSEHRSLKLSAIPRKGIEAEKLRQMLLGNWKAVTELGRLERPVDGNEIIDTDPQD